MALSSNDFHFMHMLDGGYSKAICCSPAGHPLCQGIRSCVVLPGASAKRHSWQIWPRCDREPSHVLAASEFATYDMLLKNLSQNRGTEELLPNQFAAFSRSFDLHHKALSRCVRHASSNADGED